MDNMRLWKHLAQNALSTEKINFSQRLSKKKGCSWKLFPNVSSSLGLRCYAYLASTWKHICSWYIFPEMYILSISTKLDFTQTRYFYAYAWKISNTLWTYIWKNANRRRGKWSEKTIEWLSQIWKLV